MKSRSSRLRPANQLALYAEDCSVIARDLDDFVKYYNPNHYQRHATCQTKILTDAGCVYGYEDYQS
jgi:hypothetical protein